MDAAARPPRYAIDDASAAMHFMADVRPILRRTGSTFWVETPEGQWTRDKGTVARELLRRCLQANILKIRSNGVVVPMSGNVSSARGIIRMTKAMLPDDNTFGLGLQPL